MEQEALEKNPNLELAQWKFLLESEDHKKDKEIKNLLQNAIKENDMAPFYKSICDDLKWPLDENLYKTMKEKNMAKLQILEDAILDAQQNLGDTEIRSALLAKAEYLCKIGEKDATLTAIRIANDKTTALGHRLDLVFFQIRIGLFYLDHDLISRNIEKAKSLIDEGGDWDRRNRLKAYQAVYSMCIRDFKTASELFLDTVSTFTSYELMEYKTFITYAVLCSVIALPRTQIRAKVIKGAEITEVLYGIPLMKEYLNSLYDCHYSLFFKKLAEVESKIKLDRYLSPHYRYYLREMRILAYSQLLQSYKSLSLVNMAQTFGVSVPFIDKELSRFIADGRLHCKIDKVAGTVETTRPDHKNFQYQATIKHGDILLNRIQKLSRMINV
ncbi:unnamed protein product [Gordionus sp. m RMFG-2023]|uniref:26S proteasome non-ATPase regulatory subunit 6-like n=1 Tax=Gordionus sp. m RMFG-2023 TaxID=3053472 RepID=UPI0030E30E22